MQASIASIAARPLVCPSPIIATSVEPAGISVRGHSSSACSVINSSAASMIRSLTLPVGNQGIEPFQYSSLALLGVVPLRISATTPIFRFGPSTNENASRAADFRNLVAAVSATWSASIWSSKAVSKLTVRCCSSIGSNANSKPAKLVQLVRGLRLPAEVPTACSKNASVWQMNGSSSGSSTVASRLSST
jgi:hypothetical protein